jgi:hypothetical protein
MVEYIKNKKDIFFYIFLFLNPFLIFLNQNINKFNLNNFLIFLQIILFFLICFLILSLIFFYLLKKKASFNKIFFILLIINFFSFFHHDLKMMIPMGRISSEIALISIILLSIMFIFSLNKNSILNHILFFLVFLNFSYYFSMIILKSPSIFFSDSIKIENIDLTYEMQNIGNNKNIYLIINDEATSLELFEKYYDFKIKNQFLNELEKYNYEYVSNSKSSYNQTELTFTSMFYLDYFLNHKSKEYKNTKNFYPQNLRISYDEMPLIKLLNSINYNFYFIGNTRGDCKTFVKRNCIVKKNNFSDSINQHKSILEVFLLRSPYIPIYAKINEKIRRALKIPMYKNNYNENDAIKKFITNIDILKYPKNSFFLIHNLYPHAPYIYNKDCSQKKIQREIISTYNTNKVDISKGYFENYLCSLKKTLQFIKYLEKNDKDAVVIFQGDHGKYFKKDSKIEKVEIFNIVKKSKTCNNNISSQIDNVNAVRYLIDCATNIKINLIEKETFWGPYKQTDKDWGKLFKID